MSVGIEETDRDTNGETSPDRSSRAESARFSRRDAAALGVCVLAGLLLSTLPELIWLFKTGSFCWVSERDEVVYLEGAADAYRFGRILPRELGRTTDPKFAMGPWLPIAPFVGAARLLGAGPLAILHLWHVAAGFLVPIGIYVLLRQFLRRPWPIAALTVLLMADIGYTGGVPVLRQAWVVAKIALGSNPWRDPSFTPANTNYQWRVYPIGVTQIALLLCAAALCSARAKPSWKRCVAAGVAFGLTFHMYFYYWTAVGAALLLGWALDSGKRRAYFRAGWIGGLLGAPAIYLGMLQRGDSPPEVFERLDLFLKCPRLAHIQIVYADTILLILLGLYVWTRGRALVPLWLIATTGWLLFNQQVATGFLMQNFHYRYAVYGPTLTVLALLALALEATAIRPRAAAFAFFLSAIVNLPIGVWFRAMDATMSKCSLDQVKVYHAYLDQSRRADAPRLETSAVAAGDLFVMEWAVVLDGVRPLADVTVKTSPSVLNREWHLRESLNSYLLGLDRREFEAYHRDVAIDSDFGPWRYDSRAKAAAVAERLEDYDRIRDDPAAFLRRFEVRYAFLPPNTRPPTIAGFQWTLAQPGPFRAIWECRSTEKTSLETEN